MKKIGSLLFILFIFASSNAINIIPHPFEYDINPYYGYEITNYTKIIVHDKDLIPMVNIFAEQLRKSTGFELPLARRGRDVIFIAIDKSIKHPDGYYLNVSTSSVELYAGSLSGAYYGLQSIMQMLPPQAEADTLVENVKWVLPVMVIDDYPQYSYRGVHLDLARRFFPISFIKRQIDVISKYKFNRLHLHLTDDQAWRVEIKQYPLLTEVGSSRIQQEGDTIKGFYTQQELRDLVEYAALRAVEIIPEIEMPGHAMAALTAYPWLGCRGENYKVRNEWGVEENLLCAGSDSTFIFLENVLSEIAEIFPSKYIHIGGDESPMNVWAECGKCGERMIQENLDTVIDLHSYFLNRVENILNKLGKTTIAWDEILDSDLPTKATVMAWRGDKAVLEAAKRGNFVINTPWYCCYFDHYQGNKLWEPMAQGGYADLKKVYEFSPIPNGLFFENYSKVLGAQANVWVEYIYSQEDVEYMIYPRLLALSEVLWSQSAIRNWNDFQLRCDSAYTRLDYYGVNYHIPLPQFNLGQYVEFVDSQLVELNNTRDYPIYYLFSSDSMNNPIANENWKLYDGVLNINSSGFLYAASLAPNGRFSNIIDVELVKHDVRLAALAKNQEGLLMQSVDGLFVGLEAISNAPFSELHPVEQFFQFKHDDFLTPSLLRYEGYFEVDEEAQYVISTNSEALWISGDLIIDNTFRVKRSNTQQSVVVLQEGKHHFQLVVNNCVNQGFPAIWRNTEIFIKRIDEAKFHKITNFFY